MLNLPRCHAAPCEEKVRAKRSVRWEASLSLHLSSLNSQSGEPYMNSADCSTIVNALNNIQSHLQTEEAKVDQNGLHDLIQRVLMVTIGTVLAVTFGLSKCQHTFRSGIAAV